jgi:sphinganine-1-phosphate aldolase
MPGVGALVEAETAKTLARIEDFVLGSEADPDAHRELPAKGMAYFELMEKMRKMKSGERRIEEGKAFGGIYHAVGADLDELQGKAWALFSSSNALYPGIFRAVRKMEAEIVAMTVKLLGGGDDACGALTSGGTESILLAILAYREQAKAERGVTAPEVIACATCHSALDKACHYFGVKLVKLAPDDTYRLPTAAVKRAINRNTIAIYASAPTFPHGVIDPIEDLAALAQAHGVGLHVDNCLGGFLLSFLAKAGAMAKPFDFSVPGVTSISVDIHKYGFASKGASVVLYSSKELRRHQYTIITDWAGGLYCTPTIQGSRSGANIAQAWATLLYMGSEGYERAAREVLAVTTQLKDGISAIPGLRLMTDADACILPFTSDVFNIYTCVDKMAEKGWDVPSLMRPAGAHICVGERTGAIAEAWLSDLAACAAECMEAPGAVSDGLGGIYGMAGSLPDGEVTTIMKSYLDTLYKVK